MTGVEIDMVVTDSLKALELYEKIFDIERIEVTNLSRGLNEAVFSLYGTRFHLLDENPQYNLTAPKPDDPKPIWFNIMVPDIALTFSRAVNAGCTQIQPITEMADYGMSNAIFGDPFGYAWMIHQIHRNVSFEERMKMWEEKE